MASRITRSLSSEAVSRCISCISMAFTPASKRLKGSISRISIGLSEPRMYSSSRTKLRPSSLAGWPSILSSTFSSRRSASSVEVVRISTAMLTMLAAVLTLPHRPSAFLLPLSEASASLPEPLRWCFSRSSLAASWRTAPSCMALVACGDKSVGNTIVIPEAGLTPPNRGALPTNHGRGNVPRKHALHMINVQLFTFTFRTASCLPTPARRGG